MISPFGRGTRSARVSQAGYFYQVLNRGNGRRTVFDKEGVYAPFVRLLGEAADKVPAAAHRLA
jgi:hypothetical protein